MTFCNDIFKIVSEFNKKSAYGVPSTTVVLYGMKSNLREKIRSHVY